MAAACKHLRKLGDYLIKTKKKIKGFWFAQHVRIESYLCGAVPFRSITVVSCAILKANLPFVVMQEFMPTKEEEKLLLSFNGDKTKLGKAEQVSVLVPIFVTTLSLPSSFFVSLFVRP